MTDESPTREPEADGRVLRRILQRIDERALEDEPGIIDVDALLPINLPKRPGRNLRWPKKETNNGTKARTDYSRSVYRG